MSNLSCENYGWTEYAKSVKVDKDSMKAWASDSGKAWASDLGKAQRKGISRMLKDIFSDFEETRKSDPELVKELMKMRDTKSEFKKLKQRAVKRKTKKGRSMQDDLADALQTEVRRLNGNQ